MYILVLCLINLRLILDHTLLLCVKSNNLYFTENFNQIHRLLKKTTAKTS